mgnify:CR=1 FL=1
MVSALPRSDDQVLCGLMRLLRWEMALSTFVTPCPISSRTMYRTKSREEQEEVTMLLRLTQHEGLDMMDDEL